LVRNFGPENDFCTKVRGSVSGRENIVLIFDECTPRGSETLGDLQNYGVRLDVWRKTIGNGYALTAVGTRR
jgi:glutamate-1-semialdehyde aminotransferase